jgi:excisionase family DNA binding protein
MEGKKLMNVGEVAKFLNLSVSQIYKLSESGELGSIKLGKSLRFNGANIYEYIQKCVKKEAKKTKRGKKG